MIDRAEEYVSRPSFSVDFVEDTCSSGTGPGLMASRPSFSVDFVEEPRIRANGWTWPSLGRVSRSTSLRRARPEEHVLQRRVSAEFLGRLR